MPYTYSQEVWKLKAVAETKVLDTEFERCQAIVIEITTVGFSGTIDIQGKLHEVSAYSNIPYIRQDQATIQTPSVAQISHSTDTGIYRFVVLGYWRRLRLVMTWTAGTISCGVAGSSDAMVFPYMPVGIVAGDAFGEVQDTPTAYTQLRRLKDIVTAVAALGYEFTIDGINFNDYSLIKTLWLPSEANQLATVNFQDAGSDYTVPADHVFIATKVTARIEGVDTVARIGEGLVGGDIVKDVLSLGVGTGYPFMEKVMGVYAATKYIKAKTNHNTNGMSANSALYGIEVVIT